MARHPLLGYLVWVVLFGAIFAWEGLALARMTGVPTLSDVFRVIMRYPVGPGFLESAVTGTALLPGLAAPVFAALSWLAERRARDHAEPGEPGQAPQDCQGRGV